MESKINIQSYPNFLTDQEQNYVIAKTLKGNTWEFSGFSVADEFIFWVMILMQDTFFTEHMLNKIKIATKKNFVIDRVYANGQTYGLSGSYHQDMSSNDNTYKTFLYYVNPNWKSEWGGSTLFKQDEEVYIQPFISNNAILFDSTIYHAGLDPTRHCKDLRVTVAFKLKYISDIEEI
jgi:Rps23 Pro-64 3,4-dihydroxylase Tpa1-like proline 4-hydroxylase